MAKFSLVCGFVLSMFLGGLYIYIYVLCVRACIYVCYMFVYACIDVIKFIVINQLQPLGRLVI